MAFVLTHTGKKILKYSCGYKKINILLQLRKERCTLILQLYSTAITSHPGLVKKIKNSFSAALPKCKAI
jgi:hypothetical protein